MFLKITVWYKFFPIIFYVIFLSGELCCCGLWLDSTLCENSPCMYVYLIICSWVPANTPTLRGKLILINAAFWCATPRTVICVWIGMCVSACVFVCVLALQRRHVLWRLHERGKSVAGSQTRILPELRRKLNESGCKIYSLFDFHLLTPATESPPPIHPRAITGSAQEPLAHACKCTITPASHFNADVPGRRGFGVGWKLNVTSVHNWSSCLLFLFFSSFFLEPSIAAT